MTIIEPQKVKPKFIPLMCPVCKGHMTVNWGKELCKACKGLGYIKVPPEGEGEDSYGKSYK